MEKQDDYFDIPEMLEETTITFDLPKESVPTRKCIRYKIEKTIENDNC